MHYLKLQVRIAMYISSGKIALRDFQEDDITLKVEWINDPRNNWYLHYSLPLEYDKTLNWFQGRNMKKRLDCMIEYDGIPVGLIGLLEIDPTNKKAEYYITIGAHDYKNRGIATGASRLILDYAFDVLLLNKVYLNVDAENRGACALYEKLGMMCEGVFIQDLWHRGAFVDRKRYAITRDRYQNRLNE